MKRICSVTVCFLFIMVAGTNALAVTIGDKDWRQLSETINLSYIDLDVIYDTATGQLDTGATSVGGVDFAGWTWASMDDVKDLFIELTGYPFDGGRVGYREAGSTWAPAFFELFDPLFDGTVDGHRVHVATGKTRSTTDGIVINGIVQNHFPDDVQDLVSVGSYSGFDSSSRWNGVWVYKDLSNVPEPATMILFGIGLLGLAGMNRRSK